MPATGDATLPATRRSRKSTSGHSPARKAAEKENVTVDVASSLAASRKKSRSKSIGPGGLDVLKAGAGNRRVSLAVPSRPPPRSILKPTIPILPEIPPHKSQRASAVGPSWTGGPDAGRSSSSSARSSEDDSTGTKVALRTEEEQQAAAREREERERAALEKEVNDRREARRKSLANRRVSFAAEATLHTFHEIEYLQDSTTSTDSTRRASSLATASPAPAPAAPHPASDASEPPSTPPELADEPEPDSPANQRDLHQKKLRRSSGISPLDFHSSHDDTLNTTVYSSDSEHGDGIIEDQGEEASDSGSDSDDNDGTLMTLDADEVTSASAMSVGSMMSTDSTSSLDEMLRIAQQRAGARAASQIEDEEEEEVIPAFVGWGKKKPAEGQASRAAAPEPDLSSSPMKMDDDMDGGETGMDMDITHAVGGIVRDNILSSPRDQDDEDSSMDMSMDMTSALGGIVGQKHRRPNAQSQDQTAVVDQTMEFTMAMGGIQRPGREEEDEEDGDSNEDMSMEMTTVMGGVLPPAAGGASTRQNGRRRTIMSAEGPEADAVAMDMTVGLGQILRPDVNGDDDQAEDQDEGNMTMGMAMETTRVLGGIIKPATPQSASVETLEKAAQDETPEPPRPPEPQRAARGRPKKAASPSRTLEAPRAAAQRKVSPARAAPTQPPRTPEKSPTPKFIGSRSKSPKRQGSPQSARTPVSPGRQKASPSKAISPSKGIFCQDPTTGASTPRVVLTPQRRRLSGVGADRPGLGSPKVAQLLERRGSIGEAARSFVSGQGHEPRRTVAFEDPRAIVDEVDRQRQDELAREDGRLIMEREAENDDKDATLNLRELIQGLSPKKNPLRGRKSLHVGSAKGLLGKRPAELDDEAEDGDDRDGVKRLRGLQGSPVKNIKLQQPPTKAETTGRMTRSTKGRQEVAGGVATPTLESSPKEPASGAPSPKGQKQFKDVQPDRLPASASLDFEDPPPTEPDKEDLLQNVEEDDAERISLQDFLNMTSIRFMELTTTKRRHTVAPTATNDGPGQDDGPADTSFERCVVAGVCTVPSLEMYQHSCRELKKYIAEGRDIVREIETETLEDNPPLFREYMSASPEFKLLMDSQFKNVKAHARLLSKAMWYEWRMKLQEGLKEGLLKTVEGMTGDDQVLQKQQALLDSVLPLLVKRLETLEGEHQILDEAARELADCDPEELQGKRDELLAVSGDLADKKRRITELRQELLDSETGVTALAEQKQQCLVEIKEAERVREECRGWSSSEITALKARVEAIEQEHGWAVTGCAGTTVSMTYRREIELVFDPTCFQLSAGKRRASPPSPIDLWHVGASRERDAMPLTPEKDFFLQCIRDHVRGLDQPHIPLSRMLGAVRAGWGKAGSVARHVRSINLTFPTRVSRTSDSSIVVKAAVLLAPLKAKVEVAISLHCRPPAGGASGDDDDGGIHVSVSPHARVIYGGENFSAEKMTEFLVSHIGDRVPGGKDEKEAESWGDVLVALHAKLLLGARK